MIPYSTEDYEAFLTILSSAHDDNTLLRIIPSYGGPSENKKVLKI
jgi:hypothetical protein